MGPNNQSQTTATSPALQPRNRPSSGLISLALSLLQPFPTSLHPHRTVWHRDRVRWSLVGGDRRLAFCSSLGAGMEEAASRLTLRNTALWLHAQHSRLKEPLEFKERFHPIVRCYITRISGPFIFHFISQRNTMFKSKCLLSFPFCETKTSPAYILQGSEDFNVNSSRKCLVS